MTNRIRLAGAGAIAGDTSSIAVKRPSTGGSIFCQVVTQALS